jgi:dienelactone hydrolase
MATAAAAAATAAAIGIGWCVFRRSGTTTSPKQQQLDAQQPKAGCCPPDAEPLLVMADYQPKGEMVALGDDDDLQCYVAWPEPHKANGRAVVVFQDVFGIHTGRHKQFCDMLAELGYGAVAPDFTRKSPIVNDAPMYGCTCCCFMSMFCGVCCGSFKRKTRALTADNAMRSLVLDVVVPHVLQRGVKQLASVGFCWGSYGAMVCGQAPQHFACSVSFHPSTEGICKGNGEDDLALCRAVRVPQLCVATSMESARWQPGGAAQQACEEGGGTIVEWFLEAEQKHGFMMRGDTSNAATLAAIKKWMDKMLSFFDEHMQ